MSCLFCLAELIRSPCEDLGQFELRVCVKVRVRMKEL